MADSARGPRKQKMQLAMEEDELRSLCIPSSAHRGALLPSKNSYLPTLHEQAKDRSGEQRSSRTPASSARGAGNSRSATGNRVGAGVVAYSEAERKGGRDWEEEKREAMKEHNTLFPLFSAELLDHVKKDFFSNGNALSVEQFTRAILRNLPAAGERQTSKLISFEEEEARASAEPRRGPESAAAIVELFKCIDVHAEGTITWEDMSNYYIEQGGAGGRDEFTVDTIKMYEPSAVTDQTKHENAVEKLLYVDAMDAVVCLTRDARRFRLYDPKRWTIRNEVVGHRGTVINACYVNALSQLATTGADMTICLWDSQHLGLRNRMSTKELQLCLQWDDNSNSLFSGSIDGTLSRWDLTQMCLADTRKGGGVSNHRGSAAINELLVVPDVNLLASASSDGNILMWDTALMKPKKTFKGHKKGTYSLSYSMDYHCLLTAGLDQEAFVWNPYVVSMPIFRLKGHLHALSGVTVVPGTPQIITGDVTGVFRLFDMRNFRCIQTFGSKAGSMGSGDLNSFCAIPPHNKVAAGSNNRVCLYDCMDEWGGESVTDSGGVADALYSPHAGCFYTVSNKSMKAWTASGGHLFKALRDIAKHEVTAACLADNGRKVYLGDSQGRIAVHGLSDGALLVEFEPHKADISCLKTMPGTERVFSASCDGVVKIFADERSRAPHYKIGEFAHHNDGVTCLACCPALRLLATGSTDTQVFIYDTRTLKLEKELRRLQHAIASVDFLASRCLLAVADQGGVVSLWLVRPHVDRWSCVYHFRNTAAPICRELPAIAGDSSPGAPGSELPPPQQRQNVPAQPTPLTALCFLKAGADASAAAAPRLYTADTKGTLRCWDLSVLFERRNIREVSPEELLGGQRSARLAATSSSSAAAASAQPTTSQALALPPVASALTSQPSDGTSPTAPPIAPQQPVVAVATAALSGVAAGAGYGSAAGSAPLQASSSTGPGPPRPRSKEGLGSGGGAAAFLTAVEPENEDAGGIPSTTVRAAAALASATGALALTDGRAPSSTASPSPVAVCSGVSAVAALAAAAAAGTMNSRQPGHGPATLTDQPDVQAIHEIQGHAEPVLRLQVTSAPAAVISCGLDRRVAAWGLDLEPLGVLLQSGNGAFQFPYDPCARKHRDKSEAEELLQRIGPVQARALPIAGAGAAALSGAGAAAQPDGKVVLDSRGGPQSARRRRQPELTWRLAAERVMEDADADEEQYAALLDQMLLSAVPGAGAGKAEGAAQERLAHDGRARQAGRMRHRGTALSRAEASAAKRLALAMEALGGDDFGTYAAMAKSVDPRSLSAR
eukprot:TRINITY_DN3759_c1_g1_i2.p1 TRINITY_DN3759_c1_g1~~TRINITY_DN3759_c1_g1_i2.p1  ORF type:complete len:1336 (-),score=255.21 TRINITY_DN3759_c1_g1_i2:128-4009(-)